MASTDVDALTGGFRSRLWLLVLVVVGALGAAYWTSSQDQGIGEPEDRRRLLVVTHGHDIDYYAVLERGGFVIEVDSLADWEAGARELLPDSEAEGAALVVEFADLRGFGYVVFEDPGELDFGALEDALEPSPSAVEDFAERDYAVVSVGDLAFPHHLSVDAVGQDPVLQMPGYGALEALFEQPGLLVREDEDRPTIEELQYEAAIKVARWMHERPATFAAAIEFAQAGVEGSLAADAGTRSLVGPFSAGSAVPSPDGGMLVVHHRLEPSSLDARALELRPGDEMRFDYLSPAALTKLLDTGELELEPCPSLAEGGRLDMDREPHLEAADDGSALSISTTDGETEIWLDRDGPGCEWERAARLPDSASGRGVLAPRRARVKGSTSTPLLARVARTEAGATIVELWLTGAGTGEPGAAGQIAEHAGEPDDGSTDLHALELLRVDDARLTELAFVDPHTLVVVSREELPPPEQTSLVRADFALHVLDRRQPGAHLRVPAQFFAEGRALREVVVLGPAVRDEHGPRLAITTTGGAGAEGSGETELVSLTIGAAAWQAFEDGADDTSLEAGLVTLTPDDLDVTVLGRGQALSGLVASPSGDAVAYLMSTGPGAPELAITTLAGPPNQTRQLTDNQLVDGLPRFGADGSHLVFVSLVRSSLGPTPFSVPRIIEVSPLSQASPSP